MSKGLNWEKASRDRPYIPSRRAGLATWKQLDYIRALARQKGQSMPRMPKTKGGASDHIERLLALPDIEPNGRAPEPRVTSGAEQVRDDRQELVTELRERFPQLTPMTANSMVQLFGQIDPLGMSFIFDALMQEEMPEDPDDLILTMLKRFLQEFGAITVDAPDLVSG